MCGGCRNCKTHGNLVESTIVIAKFDKFTDYEFLVRFVGTLNNCLLELGSGGIPLEDTCVLAVNPFCILVK